MRIRELQNPESEHVWLSRCEDQKVVIRSVRAGRERETTKVFDDVKAAERYAEKEEASRLRKGWVLNNPAAAAAQPRMHLFLRGPYTGAMAIEPVGERLVCNRFDGERDNLYVIDRNACVLDVIEAPHNRLIWKARYVPDAGVLLLLADHQIITLSLEQREFKELTPTNDRPVSFLSTCGPFASWYVEPYVVVSDVRDGRVLFRKKVLSELYGGHSSQMSAQLSPDGRTLACCARPGSIILFDVASEGVRAEINGDFAMIQRIMFIADGRRLLAQELYGKWLVRCFDLDSLSEVPNWPKIRVGSTDFDLDSSAQRLAVAEGPRVEIYELATMHRLLQFTVDHVVKTSAVAFVGNYLGASTDLGCVSLYALD